MSTELFDLRGRVAVVTGGYGVLGGRIARGLVDAGASVALLGRNRASAESEAAALRERIKQQQPETDEHASLQEPIDSPEVMVLEADVLDEQQIRAALADLLSQVGGIDILINCAGGNVARARTDGVPVFDLPFDAFDEVLRLNLHGTVYPSLVFGKAIAERGKGSIVNIWSMAAVQALSGVMGYSSAKAAIDNFTRWMAVDVARRYGDGVRVNAVAPGFFITKQNKDVLLKPDGSLTERSAAILAQTPAGRFGDAAELIGPIVWLCSDASSFVTGTVIPVDGGFSAFSGV